ncbi:MAG: GntR family transcriptional regulator [Thermodesulfobacteriota bacterium]
MQTITREKFNEALEKLEMDILVGVYRPRERLIESEIMEKHGITRNAVRNIFKELQNKGLIRHIPNRGVLVAEMETREAKELYAMRVLLEDYASDLVSRHIDDSRLAGIAQANQAFEQAVACKNFKDMLRSNIEFHQAIIGGCGNSILVEMINQLRNRAIVVRHYMWLHPDQVRKSVEEHRALIAALRNRDAEAFKRMNRAHILAAYEQYTGERFSDLPGPGKPQ